VALRQRYQNPTPNDTVRLRLLTFNSNLPQSVEAIDKIEVYYLDDTAATDTNPDGRTLIRTITEGIVNDAPGSYYYDLDAVSPDFVIGNYLDVWTVLFEVNSTVVPIENVFTLYPRLWYTNVIPIVYDFGFTFQPNRITQGSKKWIIIEIIPNVPRVNELERYYTNLAIAADISITIAAKCDPCLPQEKDLRIVVENAAVEQREKVFAYYWLDTEEMDCGLYDVQFKLLIGGNTYVSEPNQLLIV
jgi:hypothetical protein